MHLTFSIQIFFSINTNRKKKSIVCFITLKWPEIKFSQKKKKKKHENKITAKFSCNKGTKIREVVSHFHKRSRKY